MSDTAVKLTVLLDNDDAYSISLENQSQVNYLADNIIKYGYRHVAREKERDVPQQDVIRIFPPHRIREIKITASNLTSEYVDTQEF